MQAFSKQIALSTLIAAVLLTGPVLASPPSASTMGQPESYAKGDRRHGHRGEGGIEHMAERLNLTAEQRGAIREIVDRKRPQMRELRDKMRANRERLQALGQGGALDETELRRLADAQGQLMAEMIVLRAKTRSEISAVLSEEQRRQLEQMRERRHERRGA